MPNTAMLTNYYSSNIDSETGEVPLPQTWAAPEFNNTMSSWMNSNAHGYSSQFDHTYTSQPLYSTEPSATTTTTTAAASGNWFDYGAAASSRHESPPTDYFGAGIATTTAGSSMSPGGAGLYPDTVYDGAYDQPLYSPFSEAPPTNHHQTYNRHKSSNSSKSKSKTSSSSSSSKKPTTSTTTTKTTTTSSSSSKTPSSYKTTSSKRKSGPSSSSSRHNNQLLDDSGMPANEVHRVASEHIGREAWRICKAEALEMAQRRVKLLEHESGALERETQQLQVNIGLMRETVLRQQMDLQDAVRRAEVLGGGY